MAEEVIYVFYDATGNEWGSFQTRNFQEALEYAQENMLQVMEEVYEYSETRPVDGADFTDKTYLPEEDVPGATIDHGGGDG
jgi:hypothetical protein